MEKPARAWTVLPLLETTARFFKDKGIESPRVDAELLLAHLLGARRIDLYLQHDRPLAEVEISRFREMVRARANGTPVQRIAGGTEFYSIPLAVADGVFIPRPETELLVDRGIAFLRKNEGIKEPLALDAGTGTGAIAIALAKNVAGLRVLAVDRSPEAAACARENAARAGVADRVEVIEGDFAEALRERPGRIALVVSNPPYVTAAEMETLPVEVREHDPGTALRGGTDGLDAYRALVPAASIALAPGGMLLLEVSDAIAEGARRLVEADGRFAEAAIEKDYAGRKRVLSAIAGSIEKEDG
ncbi:MAG: peptide chain release factor N(5)-glutamine methyltransferase [Candidatus Eisenbacteria bacterium]|nr:peptide chain release factor N(5)-glutamine methyltransferase [Candidatus Eisenbacteria bacterium]